MSVNVPITFRRSGCLLALAVLAAGCTLDKASQPAVSAPSGFGMSLATTASPDTIPRDGQSTSLVRVIARDYQDNAVVGQRLTLAVTTGTLSATDITTDSTGTASVLFTAPAANVNVSSATITAVPVSDLGTVSSGTRTIVIALAGPSVPFASFNWTPGTPAQFDLVTFDATNTTLDGVSCLDTCTYAWDFGDGGAAGTGRLATHRFTTTGTFSVRLNVTAPGPVVVTSNRTVIVTGAAPITPIITQSPTDAKVNDVVIFDGTDSKTPDGAAITSYAWDFGNGQTASTRQASTTFTVARTYTIRLTIVDEFGRTATTTKTVTIAP